MGTYSKRMPSLAVLPWRKIARRTGLVAVSALLGAAAWPAYILGVTFGLWQPLTRPRGVAASARYVSSIEDGTWFDCHVDLRRNVDTCKAWDFEGRVLADGDFRLAGEDRAATAAELKPSAVNSGGGHAYEIYLFGKVGAQSAVLVPVNDHHPHATGCKWEAATNRLACD
jgi:hypothetical protein